MSPHNTPCELQLGTMLQALSDAWMKGASQRPSIFITVEIKLWTRAAHQAQGTQGEFVGGGCVSLPPLIKPQGERMLWAGERMEQTKDLTSLGGVRWYKHRGTPPAWTHTGPQKASMTHHCLNSIHGSSVQRDLEPRCSAVCRPCGQLTWALCASVPSSIAIILLLPILPHRGGWED